eukprot:TRINITY_DN1253_c0_g1_i1.p1 TRINITY_DN1253_c0_g1~~TRINITY_DN1253_c0_g1_i1.p1  ORF type:complete len:365 (+),score=73.07 TRINITY_DN1253_c0_g1_i1:938-2032(+)
MHGQWYRCESQHDTLESGFVGSIITGRTHAHTRVPTALSLSLCRCVFAAEGNSPRVEALGVVTVADGARCVVNGTVAVTATQLLLIGADVNVNLTARIARLERGSIAEGVLVTIAVGSISGVQGKGNLTADQLNLEGSSTLNDLQITSSLSCSPNAALSVNYAKLLGSNELAGCSVTAGWLYYDSQQSHGNATWWADSGDFYWQGYLSPNYTFTFRKEVLVCPFSAVLYSTVVVQPNARANLCGFTFGADGNGQWVNHGTTAVEEGQGAAMSWIQLKGEGSYLISRNSSLDLENINATLPGLRLGGQGATLLASGVQLGWQQLAGEQDGSKIGILADQSPEEFCSSPCGPRPEAYYQKLTVKHY